MSGAKETDRLNRVQAQVDDLKVTLHDNIDLAVQRGEKIESLDKKAADLEQGANVFRKKARDVRIKFCTEKVRNWAILIGILLVIVLILFGILYSNFHH